MKSGIKEHDSFKSMHWTQILSRAYIDQFLLYKIIYADWKSKLKTCMTWVRSIWHVSTFTKVDDDNTRMQYHKALVSDIVKMNSYNLKSIWINLSQLLASSNASRNQKWFGQSHKIELLNRVKCTSQRAIDWNQANSHSQ